MFPAAWYLNQARGVASLQWLHPVVRVFLIVDRDPRISRPQPVALAVVMAKAVIVFDSILEHPEIQRKLCLKFQHDKTHTVPRLPYYSPTMVRPFLEEASRKSP